MITVKKQKLKGLIIRQENYKEDSSKITLLTENGLYNFIIKGTHKIESKLRPLSQVLTEVELVATADKVLNTITEGVVVENYTVIKEDTNKLLVALSILEDFYNFKESIIDVKTTYLFLKDILKVLCNTKYFISVMLIFELKFLYAIGSHPEFCNCVKCNNTKGIYFSVKNGGNVCKNCYEHNCCNLELSKLLELMFYIKISNLNDDFLKIVFEYHKDLNVIINEYYETYFDYRNKNKKILEKL